jgi:hypothetical protein
MKTGNTSAEQKSDYQAAADYGIDMHQLEYLLTLSPWERVLKHEAARNFVLAAREAGIRYYGVNPRHPETP